MSQVKGHIMKPVATAFAIATVLALGTQAASAQSPTLKTVRDRGELICGANGTLAGFGLPDPQGNWTGFDVDFCRAIAAAIFNDPAKVKFVPLTAANRFTALQSGEVDVLSRNTTWTMERDTTLGIDFAAVAFYDGQGFMVHKSLKVNSALELNGASVCVQQGTTTELNLADYFRSNHMDLKTVTFATADQAVKAYDTGRCDAYTTDSSGLYGERLRLADPNANIVLPEIISKEPLSPAVRQGDDSWEDLVRWTHYAMVDAEELGVNQHNVDDMRKSAAPDIRRLLGVEGQFGTALGLSNDWAYQHHQGGRQLRRKFRAQCRPRLAAQDRARAQCAVDQRRLAIRVAHPLRPRVRFVIARSEATKQSSPFWIASLRSQ